MSFFELAARHRELDGSYVQIVAWYPGHGARVIFESSTAADAGDASAALVLPGMLDLPEGLVQVTGVYRADRTSPTEGLFIPLGRIDPLLSAERRRRYSQQLERCREEDCQLDYRLGNGVVPGVVSRKE